MLGRSAKIMKSLLLTLTLICSSCVSPEFSDYKRKIDHLPVTITRKQLNDTFIPVDSPIANPKSYNFYGVRSRESYPIDDKHRINYSVLYSDSPSYEEIKATGIIDYILANPNRVKPNNKDYISNIQIKRNQTKMQNKSQ
jgi:hypothetical protein